jgi:hypothetical protein
MTYSERLCFVSGAGDRALLTAHGLGYAIDLAVRAFPPRRRSGYPLAVTPPIYDRKVEKSKKV